MSGLVRHCKGFKLQNLEFGHQYTGLNNRRCSQIHLTLISLNTYISVKCVCEQRLLFNPVYW